MKKILFSLLVSSTLFGYDILLQKNFTKEVYPSHQSVKVNITVKQQKLEDVLNKLKTYEKKFRKYKNLNIKSNGFHTLPNYVYQNSKRIKTGYKGFSNYTVSSENEDQLEKFVNEMAQDSNVNDEISLSSREWSLSETAKEKAFDQLQITAIKWAKQYQNQLSQTLNDKCKLEEINLLQNKNKPVFIRNAQFNSNLPFSKKEKQKISINAKIKYKCE